MRDRETIDSELRRIARGRRSIREQGRQPSYQEADELLDELLAHQAGVWLPDPVKPSETKVASARTKHRLRNRVLGRLGLMAAFPLCLVAIAATVVLVFAANHRDPAAGAAADSADTPAPAAPPKHVVPQALAPRVDIVDTAFIATLKHEGVPVPSQEYATTQGHAVCDFLAQQRNFAAAVGYVQRSSIWDANQSADVTAGAIASYCPQSQPTAADELQPIYQNALSDLRAIEGKLQGIEGDLQGIRGVLDGIPGH